MRRDSGDITDHVADVLHQLVADLLLGDDVYRLRNITQQRVGLRGAVDRGGLILARLRDRHALADPCHLQRKGAL